MSGIKFVECDILLLSIVKMNWDSYLRTDYGNSRKEELKTTPKKMGNDIFQKVISA